MYQLMKYTMVSYTCISIYSVRVQLILYYIVTNPLTNTVINTTNTSVIITGLTPGQYYIINITAVNIIGPGPVLMINGKLI